VKGALKAGISSMERKGFRARTAADELSDAFRANGAHLSVRLAKHARLVDSVVHRQLLRITAT
jgi:hypothetical protein